MAGALMRMRLALTYARWPLMKGLLTVFRGFAASASRCDGRLFCEPRGQSFAPSPVLRSAMLLSTNVMIKLIDHEFLFVNNAFYKITN